MYTNPFLNMALIPAGTSVLAAEVLTAAAAVHGEWLVLKRMTVKRIFFVVTVLTASNTQNPTVTFRKRSASGVTSGQSTIGVLTIPSGSAVGTILYKDVEPVELVPGNAIALDHTLQATDSGSAAGSGYYGLDAQETSEVPANESNMVASA